MTPIPWSSAPASAGRSSAVVQAPEAVRVPAVSAAGSPAPRPLHRPEARRPPHRERLHAFASYSAVRRGRPAGGRGPCRPVAARRSELLVTAGTGVKEAAAQLVVGRRQQGRRRPGLLLAPVLAAGHVSPHRARRARQEIRTPVADNRPPFRVGRRPEQPNCGGASVFPAG